MYDICEKSQALSCDAVNDRRAVLTELKNIYKSQEIGQFGHIFRLVDLYSICWSIFRLIFSEI